MLILYTIAWLVMTTVHSACTMLHHDVWLRHHMHNAATYNAIDWPSFSSFYLSRVESHRRRRWFPDVYMLKSVQSCKLSLVHSLWWLVWSEQKPAKWSMPFLPPRWSTTVVFCCPCSGCLLLRRFRLADILTSAMFAHITGLENKILV